MIPGGGVVFLDKPEGWTSRKAVNEVARLLAGREKVRIKAGHTGTLDPLATGMLPILVGEATRFADQGLRAEKIYRATIDLSFQTDTLDGEGEVIARFDPDIRPDASRIERTLASMVGEQMQRPPAYSAIRVNGKRAHELARKGRAPELAPRRVVIHELRMLAWAWPALTIETRCSKGTYIRALARDIGSALGLGGCVTMLRRISTGGWPAQVMLTPAELAECGWQAVLPLRTWLRDMDSLLLARDQACRFVRGQRIALAPHIVARGELLVLDEMNPEFVVGVGTVITGRAGGSVLQPKRVLPSAQRLLAGSGRVGAIAA
ncbi:MAG: tRNA pseudouridine(55) synthase TruB [Mariprofundaceae bacterium]